MNADERGSLTRAALSMRSAGQPLAAIIDRLQSSPLLLESERPEVASIVRSTLRIDLTFEEVEARVRAAVNPHGHARDPYGHLVPLILQALER